MAVIVELTIDADAFDLGRVTSVLDGVHIELERVVPTGRDIMPYFWAEAPDFEAFEHAVRRNELVESLEALSHVHDRVLYHVIWHDTVTNLTRILESSGATILQAHGNERWVFNLRFRDHVGLRDFHNSCQEEGLEFHVDRIYTLEEDPEGAFELGLTDEQHDALVSAVEHGYFEVPRGGKLSDVAADLGISQQAASERVRRGANRVLKKVLNEHGGENKR
ncbi:helix-turn-helix domain-containing protein [Halorubellus litoreus]|uniref:Helix-turn-helix domain-containing protein n=1 Tax=Halorubellus litoreus TaxID=755308 RepID=A0ABD5VH65_9EURY